MDVVMLTDKGQRRCPGTTGMTFVVDEWTSTTGPTSGGLNRVAHVRDYRYGTAGIPFQVWSLSPGDWAELPGIT